MSRRANANGNTPNTAGNGRAQTQRIASGARAAPYNRPRKSGGGEDVAMSTADYPTRPQISIRGTAGPTWIIISNLVRGTSEADIHETLKQFGSIEAVKLNYTPPPKGGDDTSVSYEVAFTHPSSAQQTVETLNGVLADGRLLQVKLRQAVPKEPAASSSRPTMPIPTAPRRDVQAAAQAAAAKGNVRELLPPTAAKQKQKQPAAANPLSSRILSAAELKVLSKKQDRARLAKAAGGINQPGAASLALAKRIGSLPLAQRLTQANKEAARGAQPTSSTASAAKKRKRAAAKAKKASGMQVD